MTIELSDPSVWFFPLVMFCLGDFFLVLIIRKFVENYFGKFCERNQWSKVWLPTLPALLGGVAAGVMYKFPFLSSLPTWGTRFIYGMVAGGFSSFAYKVAKAIIVAKFGVRIPESDAPPAMSSKDLPTIPVPRTSSPEEETHVMPPKGAA